jgi:hypothetical protein
VRHSYAHKPPRIGARYVATAAIERTATDWLSLPEMRQNRFATKLKKIGQKH